jgi:hypothetical protein
MCTTFIIKMIFKRLKLIFVCLGDWIKLRIRDKMQGDQFGRH